MKEKIAIIGAGLMGRGLAQVFSLAGHPTHLYDAFTDALALAKKNIQTDFELAVEFGLITSDQADSAIEIIETYVDLSEAVAGCAMVIECVPEKMDLKQSIFKSLDAICPMETILASNTSVMSITEIASTSVNKQRIIGAHFWNPPHLLPLVEVVQTEDSSAEIISKAMRILTEAGKKPIHVKKDVPGFVANRMQHALWREAFHILNEGIADAATIDEAVRSSFGLRLPVLGPLENADMIGLDLTLYIHNYILKYLADNREPSAVLRENVRDGILGFKSDGQGFQSWTAESMAASREKLSRHLMTIAVKGQTAK